MQQGPRRRALLIGASNASSPFLEGVDEDIRRLRGHLLSPGGGAWEADEIIHLSAPSVDDVNAHLRRWGNADFFFVAFSGHGFSHPQSRRSYVVLAREQYFPVEGLVSPAPRRVVLVDACRNPVPLALVEGVEKRAEFAGLAGLPNAHYRPSCRELFDRRLLAGEGSLLLQSCSLGETSVDTRQGGLFTKNLLDLTQRAVANVADHQRAQEWFSAQSAFHAGKAETMRLMAMAGQRQTPVSVAHGQGMFLPFAVA